MRKLQTLLTVFLTLLISSLVPVSASEWTAQDTEIGHFVFNLACSLEQRYGITPLVSMFDTESSVINMTFQTNRVYSREEARALLVACTEDVIAAVKADRKAQSYFKGKGQYQPEDLSLTISVMSPDGRQLRFPDLCQLKLSEGILSYDAHDPRLPALELYTTRESYKEAVQILKREAKDRLKQEKRPSRLKTRSR